MKYDLYITDGPCAGTLLLRGLTLQTAAELLTMDPPDVEWAIEQFGRCDALFLHFQTAATVVPMGAKKPGKWEDQDHPLHGKCPNDNTVW
jgi:hypothetical protein